MKKLLSLAILLAGALAFTACSDDDDNNIDYGPKNIAGHGLFVINEGSYFSKINGSLDWVSLSGDSVVRNVFQQTNKISLGGTPNDAVIDDGRLYIASTDENRVWVVDAASSMVISYVTVKNPRHLAAANDRVYVSSYTGKVYAISPDKLQAFGESSQALVDSSEVIGQRLEGIAVRNGNIYVCNSCSQDYQTYFTNVVKLNKSLDKQKDITVAANPNEIVSTSDGVYVDSWGDYKTVSADVQKIDDNDAVTSLGVQANMIAAGNGGLYMVNSYGYPSATFNFYNFSTKKTSAFTEGKEVYSAYSIAVDPESGDIFIASLNKDASTGYASYTSDGYLVRYHSDGSFVKQYTIGVCPGTIVFRN